MCVPREGYGAYNYQAGTNRRQRCMKMATFTQCHTGVLHFFSPNWRNTHSFEKYVRIKIVDHKILILMSKLSPKLDEINASYPCKYNLILRDFHIF